MKTTYKAYMDRQTVSSNLHGRLLALEQERSTAKRPFARLLPKMQRREWRGVAALAASLVLAIGVGLFWAQSGLFNMGSSNTSAMESTTVTAESAAAEEAMWEAGNDSFEHENAVDMAPAEIPALDVAPAAEESASLEETEDAHTEALGWSEQNAALLMERLPFADENAVLGAAQRLNQVGCGLIAEIEVEEDDGRVYVLNLTDEEQNVFHTVMDYEGYIGPIQDEDGNYLYAPIE